VAGFLVDVLATSTDVEAFESSRARRLLLVEDGTMEGQFGMEDVVILLTRLVGIRSRMDVLSPWIRFGCLLATIASRCNKMRE
jgi:hypothetical protein